MATETLMQISVLVSPAPRQVQQVTLQLPVGTTVREALRQSGLQSGSSDVSGGVSVGIWGRKCGLDQVLRDQDRVELYRPLRVDPKVARRERFAKQGARTTGLFARRRQGAQSGY